jgi:hypothetical protein
MRVIGLRKSSTSLTEALSSLTTGAAGSISHVSWARPKLHTDPLSVYRTA